MIDNKKIEEAAINKCGFISSEFYSGAKWAIEQLSNLWHYKSEILKEKFCILTILIFLMVWNGLEIIIMMKIGML